MEYNVNKLLKASKTFFRMSYQQNPEYEKHSSSGAGYSAETGEQKLPSFMLTQVSQDQFMKELMPQGHLINNTLYRPDTPITKDGLPLTESNSDEIIDWKHRARVAIPKQNTIAEKQRTHLAGNDLSFDLVKGDKKQFNMFNNYWKLSHAHCGISKAVITALTTGDCGLYFYIDGDDIKYKNFSYKYGDNLNHHKATSTRKECITRYFIFTDDEGVELETVEIYDDSYIYTYQKKKGAKDDFKRTDKKAHGFAMIPLAYNKLDDVAWGMGQNIIEKLESSFSDLRESNEYFQFQILFLSGSKIKVLPNASKQGKVISGSENSKAETLSPQGNPESFEKEINILTEELYDGTGVTIIDPESLKGDTSGAYVKSVYFPATSYAKNQIPNWDNFLDKCRDIVKYAVGKIEQKPEDYLKMKVSWDLAPYVPQNELEQAQISQYLVQVGARSKQTASSLANGNAPNEWELVQKEEEAAFKQAFGNQAEFDSGNTNDENNKN